MTMTNQSTFGLPDTTAEPDTADVEGYGLRSRLDGLSLDLQSQDKLGNLEIQGLMSDYNEAKTLTSSVTKKRDEAGNSIIGKI